MKANCRCVIGGLCLKQMSTSFRCSDSCRRMVEDNPHRWTIYKNYGDKPKEDNVKKKTDQVESADNSHSAPVYYTNGGYVIAASAIRNTVSLNDVFAELSNRYTYSNTVSAVSGWDSTSSGGM